MEKYKIFVNNGTNPYYSTLKLLQNFDFKDAKGKRVLIKPNAGREVKKGLGITTNPSVISALIKHLKNCGITDITIGESTILGTRAEKTFIKTGIKQIADKHRVKCINLDNNGFKEISIKNGLILKKLKVCNAFFNYNYIISVPVMKTHMHTIVSLSIKNMKGVIYGREKVRLHQLQKDKNAEKYKCRELDLAVSDLIKIVNVDFILIDGSIAMEGLGPSSGIPVNYGIYIAGKNSIACDIIATRLMGIDYKKARHISIAADYAGIKLKDIIVKPDNYLDWKRKFKLPPGKISINFSNVEVVDKGACSACMSTILLFLKRYYEKFSDYLSPDNKLKIAVGKEIKFADKNTLLVGNCTFKLKNKGIFISGCPPVPSQIFDIYKKKIR